MTRHQPSSSPRKKAYDVELAFRVGCAALNFIVAWVYLALRWPMIGIVFGWMPALLAAVFGFFAIDLILSALN